MVEGQGPGIIPGQEEYVAFESLGLTMPQPWLSHVGVSTAVAGHDSIPGVTLVWGRCREFLHADASRGILGKVTV